MKSNDTMPRLPSEHPSRERCDHANLERPEAHPGGRSLRPQQPSRAAGPRSGREPRGH